MIPLWNKLYVPNSKMDQLLRIMLVVLGADNRIEHVLQ